MLYYATCRTPKELERWVDYPRHLVLAQCYHQHPWMAELYRQMKNRKDNNFILDNGAYEGEMVSAQEYFDVISFLEPQFVIPPDRIEDSAATRALLDYFVSALEYHVSLELRRSICLLPVIQSSPDSAQMIFDYLQYTEKFPGVCFPKWWGNHRPKAIDSLKRRGIWNYGKYHHLLGLHDINNWDQADSIDSHTPVRYNWSLEQLEKACKSQSDKS